MKKGIVHLVGIIFAILGFRSDAAVFYVNNSNPTPLAPYASWATAAADIQSAVNAATDGDLVLVTNGVYQTGGSSGNRVTASKALVIQSINGPAATIIQGQKPGQGNPFRCVSLGAKATLSGFTLTGGYCTGSGGGISCASISSIITNCIITGNYATSSGGGGLSGSYYNCAIINNVANLGNGGGVYSGGVFNNCVIAGNSAPSGGGGVYLTVAMTNCTVVGNMSGSAAGAGVSTGAGIIRNCIIYYNSSTSVNNVNLSSIAATSISNCCVPNFYNQSCITNQPGIAGIAVGDYRLQAGSPCINAGDNGSAPDNIDQEGNPRIFGGTIDMGAFENSFMGTAHYVNLSNTNPVSPYAGWSSAATNIQDAIDIANQGEYIIVGNGVYKTGGRVVFGSLTNRVVIDKAVTVQSLNGPDWTVIQGNRLTGNTAVRCAYLAEQAALVGMTLSNGATRSTGDVFQEQSGAGAWCESTNTFITNCVITGGIAVKYGGGAFSGTVVNSLIKGNQTLISGGGAYASALMNCMVSNNTAFSYGGGAIGGSLTCCIVSTNRSVFGGGACSNTLVDCTLVNNSASKTGGGTYACVLTNCLLWGNGATNGGGAIYGSLSGCILSSNWAGNGGGTLSNILYNCLINYNGATTNGGGAFTSDLTGCSLLANGAGNYGGGSYYANLTNCFIWSNGANYGGGAAGGVCISCTITSNFATFQGGGVISNIAYNCMLSSNRGGASYFSTLNRCWLYFSFGGGSHSDVLNNCVVLTSIMGSGAQGSILNNCLVSGNGIQSFTYGVQNCKVTNSIVYGNFSSRNYDGLSSMNYCCTTPLPAGSGNFTNAPVYLDTIHQASNSPCINAGNTAMAADNIDYDGRPRVVAGTVDVGPSEFQGVSVEPFIAWLDQYHIPNDGSADYADQDGDGMNNWQEWLAKINPTNSQSVLKMFSPTQNNNPVGKLVSWQSVTNVSYYLQRSTNLTTFLTVQSNLVGQIDITSYTDVTATNAGPYFYRIGVQ